jgi:hypothetical protein
VQEVSLLKSSRATKKKIEEKSAQYGFDFKQDRPLTQTRPKILSTLQQRSSSDIQRPKECKISVSSLSICDTAYYTPEKAPQQSLLRDLKEKSKPSGLQKHQRSL